MNAPVKRRGNRTMNAVKMPTVEARIARCRVDIATIRRSIDGIRYDLEWISGAAPTPSVFEAEMKRLAEQIQALADHAREIAESAARKRVDGAEAEARIDAMIGSVN